MIGVNDPAYLHGSTDAQKVYETDTLVPYDLDLIDRSESRQIVSQFTLGQRVIQSTEIDVPGSFCHGDGLHNLRGNSRRFAPTDLELLTVQGELLHRRIGVEGGSSGSIQERDEDAGFLG